MADDRLSERMEALEAEVSRLRKIVTHLVRLSDSDILDAALEVVEFHENSKDEMSVRELANKLRQQNADRQK